MFGWSIKTLQNYYEFFQRCIEICVGLLDLLNSNQRDNFINEFADDSIHEIKNTIQKTEIKNALSQSPGEVYRFNFKVYAFVYNKIIFLPHSNIEYDTLTTDKFFIHVNRLIKGYGFIIRTTSVTEKTR